MSTGFTLLTDQPMGGGPHRDRLRPSKGETGVAFTPPGMEDRIARSPALWSATVEAMN